VITLTPKSLLVEVTNSGLIDIDLLNESSAQRYELETEATIADALRWIDAPHVTAFIVDDSLGQNAAVELFHRLQETRSTMPFVYVPTETPVLSSFGAVLPDLMLRRPVNHALLVSRIDEILSFRSFNDVIIDVLSDCVLASVSRSFLPDAQLHALRFRASQVPLYGINATIPLCGEGISGHLSVSASEETLRRLYGRMLPDKPAPSTRLLEDLVGEMSNQLLGGVKQMLTGGGVDFALGVPMMYTGMSCPVRYRSRSGSLLLEIHSPDTTDEIAIDLALDSMRQDYVRADEGLGPETGELAFL
jgi:CheY-specific phosphatase CheX